MLARSSQRETVDVLRQQLREKATSSQPLFSSGLVGTLPTTLRRGTIVEYLADQGAGALGLTLLTAEEACKEGGVLVIVDRSRTFHPPAAARFELQPNTIIVRPRSTKDELWALNQTLRCPGVAVVLGWPEQLPETAFRGLQIAAEHGETVGLFLRPTNARGRPSWSDTQLLIEALPSGKHRRLRIEVLRSRFGDEGVWEIVEFDDATPILKATSPVPMVAPLAAAARATGAARA